MRQKAHRGRVLKSSRLRAKIGAYLVSIGWLLFLAFLYGWHVLNKISLDWPRTLTTQLSTSKLSDNPERVKIIEGRNEVSYCAVCYFCAIKDCCKASLFYLTEPHLLHVTLQCCQLTRFARFYDLE